MWLTQATVAALPTKCSRHNSPSRPHSLTKVIRSCIVGGEEYIVVRQMNFLEGCMKTYYLTNVKQILLFQIVHCFLLNSL